MNRAGFAVLLVGLLVSVATTQSTRPWTEWSKKDVEKTLNDSAWGQTQTEGESARSDTNSSAVTQVAAPGSANINRSGESGESKPTTSIKFRIRLLTARPIREAFARQVVLSRENPPEELTQQLQGFIDRDFNDYIIVAVNVETNDQRVGNPLLQTFNKMTAEMLKDIAYLERKDGKRLPIQDYRAPAADGMGAKFVFPRQLNGQPFVLDDKDSVKFVVQLNE